MSDEPVYVQAESVSSTLTSVDERGTGSEVGATVGEEIDEDVVVVVVVVVEDVGPVSTTAKSSKRSLGNPESILVIVNV